jgi:putative oxidoreductase
LPQKFGIGIFDQSSHDAEMKIATIIARILLGLVFVVFGSNFFLNFIPMPPPPPGLAGDYFKVFAASGYMYVVGALQLLSGLLLLIGRFVPLALTILAAMIFNILVFHILMDPKGLPTAIVVAVFQLFLVWSYRDRFAGILRP